MTISFDNRSPAYGEFVIGGRECPIADPKRPDFDNQPFWLLLIGGLFASGLWRCWLSL